MTHAPGHKELTDIEVEHIQLVRNAGESLEQLLELLEGSGADGRWIAIARTDLQKGLMSAVRGITQPDFF